MKIWKIIILTIIGFLLGCAITNLNMSGILQRWEKLPNPPSDLNTYFSGGENQTREGGRTITNQCDFSTSEFFFTTNPPPKIVNCAQEKQLYPEAMMQTTYVRDGDGQIWIWTHSDYAGPGGEDICILPILGLLSGFIISLFLIRSAKTNTA